MAATPAATPAATTTRPAPAVTTPTGRHIEPARRASGVGCGDVALAGPAGVEAASTSSGSVTVVVAPLAGVSLVTVQGRLRGADAVTVCAPESTGNATPMLPNPSSTSST